MSALKKALVTKLDPLDNPPLLDDLVVKDAFNRQSSLLPIDNLDALSKTSSGSSAKSPLQNKISDCNIKSILKESNEENKESKNDKHIKWSNINIREYNTTIQPCSIPISPGIPIGLGWDITNEYNNIDLNTYEETKIKENEHLDNKRYERDGSLTILERQWIIQKAGIKKSEISAILKDVYIKFYYRLKKENKND